MDYTFLIERIDDLSGQIRDITTTLEDSDQDPVCEPLYAELRDVAGRLKAVYNEFCRLGEEERI